MYQANRKPPSGAALIDSNSYGSIGVDISHTGAPSRPKRASHRMPGMAPEYSCTPPGPRSAVNFQPGSGRSSMTSSSTSPVLSSEISDTGSSSIALSSTKIVSSTTANCADGSYQPHGGTGSRSR